MDSDMNKRIWFWLKPIVFIYFSVAMIGWARNKGILLGYEKGYADAMEFATTVMKICRTYELIDIETNIVVAVEAVYAEQLAEEVDSE